MRQFLSPINDFLIKYYHDIQKYIQITTSLLKQDILDYEQALSKIRTKLYESYNQIQEFLAPIERKFERFNNQVLISLQVIYHMIYFLDKIV